MSKNGRTILLVIAVVAVITIVGNAMDKYDSYSPAPVYSTASTSATVSTSSETKQIDCNTLEPSNPYDEYANEGHYAGYEWEAENGGECDTGKDSFDEGCSEYLQQWNDYNNCLAEQNK